MLDPPPLRKSPFSFLPSRAFSCRKKTMPKKLTMAKLADKPAEVYLPKSDNQKIMELKRLLIDGAGQNVVGKALQIALDDKHPAQAAMIKLCMDRMLPISLFEKGVAARSAVTINITGIGESVSVGGEDFDLSPKSEPIDVTPEPSMNGASHSVEIQ